MPENTHGIFENNVFGTLFSFLLCEFLHVNGVLVKKLRNIKVRVGHHSSSGEIKKKTF